MVDVSSKGGEAACTGRNLQAVNSLSFSRRSFLAKTSCFGAFYALAKLIPLAALAAELASDSRVSPTPIVDKGFASVRKIGSGLYATISDPSKGYTTICNGGFLAGKDGALLIEGFAAPSGASFQMDALRMVSQVPVKGALDTHSMRQQPSAWWTTIRRCKVQTKGQRWGRSRSASKMPSRI